MTNDVKYAARLELMLRFTNVHPALSFVHLATGLSFGYKHRGKETNFSEQGPG